MTLQYQIRPRMRKHPLRKKGERRERPSTSHEKTEKIRLEDTIVVFSTIIS